jgi:phosphoglycolate phosphatase-like HAD superfamily hydrolase
MVRREDIEPRPGVETTFAALRAVGVHVCLTTNQPRASLDHVIDVLGWRDLVDVVLAPDPEDGLRAAPAPDLLLAAALRLHADDVREIAVASDSVDDLVAGARAGASIIAAVPSRVDDVATLRSAPHTHLLRAIDEFPALVTAANGGAVDASYSSSGGK